MNRRGFFGRFLGLLSFFGLALPARTEERQVGLPLESWMDLAWERIKPYAKHGGSFDLRITRCYGGESRRPEIYCFVKLLDTFPFGDCGAIQEHFLRSCSYIWFQGRIVTLQARRLSINESSFPNDSDLFFIAELWESNDPEQPKEPHFWVARTKQKVTQQEADACDQRSRNSWV